MRIKSLLHRPVRPFWGGMARCVAVAVWSLVAAPGVLAQQANVPLMVETEARYQDVLRALKAIETPRSDLATVTGLAVPMAGAPADMAKADMRVALLKLARPDEDDARTTVLEAQGPRGAEALSLRSGEMNLAQLLAMAERVFPGSVGAHGLEVPLIIEKAATLVLTDGAVLPLNRAKGAFLANFGRLDIRGGGVVAVGPRNLHAGSFAPFVVTAGQGVMTAHNAHFADLGFGSKMAFAGLSVMVSGFYQNDTPSVLTGSVMRRVGSTVFVGATSAEISDNRFVNSRRTALILRATTAARIHRNTFVDGDAGDAIRLAPRTIATDIRTIEIFNPKESGIALLTGSDGTKINDVTIWRPRHHGVRAESAHCLEMNGLNILGSRQEGIVLHGAQGAVLSNSAVIASHRAGLLITDLPDHAVTHVSHTQFALNRIGIETAAPGQIDLRYNNFQDQFPRFLAGDVQFMTPRLLGDLTGKARIVLVGGGAPTIAPAPPACPTYQEH